MTRQMYYGAQITTLNVKRSISQKGSARKPVSELLALFKHKPVYPITAVDDE